MSCSQPGLRLGLFGQPQGTVLSPFSTDVPALGWSCAGLQSRGVCSRHHPPASRPGQPSSTRAASSLATAAAGFRPACQLGSARPVVCECGPGLSSKSHTYLIMRKLLQQNCNKIGRKHRCGKNRSCCSSFRMTWWSCTQVESTLLAGPLSARRKRAESL